MIDRLFSVSFRRGPGTWLVLVVALAVAPIRAEIIEQVLVKVNGDILTKTEFEQRQVSVLRTRPELAEITPQLVLDAVDELLLLQRGHELGYVLGDEQFKSIVENIKKQNNLEDEERFQSALKQEGMTMADLRRSLERQMLVSRVQQTDVDAKISVTEDEEKAYYSQHAREFTTPAAITLREILIEVAATSAGINVAQDDQARAEADALHRRLVGGEPFPRLAAEVSDAPSKANGGLIGPFNYDELAPALQALIDGVKVGGVLDPIRTQRGYQILKLESRTETKTKTFDEAREEIGEKIAAQKRQGEMQKYLDRLRRQATITWRNDELKRAYDKALADRQASDQQAPQPVSKAS
jgi:peptidyl-prolyl cis-trans isomerase SurA